MYFRLCFAMIFAAGLLYGGELRNLAREPGVSYRVYPGKWNRGLLSDKYLGGLIDTDWQRATGQRHNLLVNGKTRESAVRYNYHSTLERERFLIIDFDLGKTALVQHLKVSAFKNNSLYEMKKVQVWCSKDNFVYQANGSAGPGQIRLEKDVYQAEITPQDVCMRFVRIGVWAHSWINVTEIEVWGAWQ